MRWSESTLGSLLFFRGFHLQQNLTGGRNSCLQEWNHQQWCSSLSFASCNMFILRGLCGKALFSVETIPSASAFPKGTKLLWRYWKVWKLKCSTAIFSPFLKQITFKMESTTQTELFKEINYFKHVKEISSPLPPLVETIYLNHVWKQR